MSERTLAAMVLNLRGFKKRRWWNWHPALDAALARTETEAREVLSEVDPPNE